MSLKLDGLYSIKETTAYVDISPRLLQMYANKNQFKKIDNRWIFTGHQIKELIDKRNEKRNERKNKKIVSLKKVSEELETIKAEELEGFVTETFTDEEHEQLQKLIYNEPLKKDRLESLVENIKDYKNEIEYLRRSLDKKDEQMNLLIHSVKESLETIKETQKNMQQRNYIEVLKEQEKKK
jgi:hypothetical protein